MRSRTAAWLNAHPTTWLPLWAVVTSFATYFCMYAFRKPFSAASYEELVLLGGYLTPKTAFVVSQVLGYTLSKYLGVKICAEITRKQRLWALFAAIVVAELALLLFAVLPGSLKLGAIFLNGLPLGMVWGFVVAYLEGRRSSEMQLAGLSCSFIVASGVVKDAGRWVLSLGVPEIWMPVSTGLLFLVPFLLSAWLLDMLPEPNEGDVEERVERRPMTGKERIAFCRRFAVGLLFLLLVYFGLTAFRDFRDNFGVELFAELGYGEAPGIFSRSELWVALGVLAALVPISWIRDNHLALKAVFGMLIAGCALIATGSALLQAGQISGVTWMILVGLGAYLAYVPFGSVLFDRVVAATRTVGTAVFAIYLCDSVGYTGSVALMFAKDLFQADATYLAFFLNFSYVLSLSGIVLLAISYLDFARAARHAQRHTVQPVPHLEVATVGAEAND